MSKQLSASEDHSEFDHLMTPYYQDIKKYCFSLTPSIWEAEDLLQDTLIKIYLALKQQPEREISKRFLYRIAKNTWIDQKRKKNINTESIDDHGENIENIGRDSYEYQLREALEILAEY